MCLSLFYYAHFGAKVCLSETHFPYRSQMLIYGEAKVVYKKTKYMRTENKHQRVGEGAGQLKMQCMKQFKELQLIRGNTHTHISTHPKVGFSFIQE